MENTETLQLTIDHIAPGGMGLGRADGRVLLVPLTAPGDQVTVLAEKGKIEATLVSLDVPSDLRLEPSCQHFGVCGGCDFMHLNYPAQLSAKEGMIAEAMRRTGGFTEFPPVTVMPAPILLGSRLRASWRPSPDIGAGYFRRGSHEVIAIEHCPIIDPALEIVRRRLQPARAVQALTNGADVSIAEEGELAGSIEMTVGPYRLLATSDVFFQASGGLLEPFLEAVIAAADVQEGDRVQDLYAGIGLFSIPLAKHAATVDGIEAHESAVLLGIDNIQRNGVTNCAMQAMTVENWLRYCPPAEVTVIDPPRSGISKSVATLLPGKVQRRLVYVSCDPVTFARDARRLETGGLRLMSVQGFDMFPHTHHVELVGIFDRKNTWRGPRPTPESAETPAIDG